MKFTGLFLALLLIPSMAFADGRELSTKKITELETLAGASVASDDYTLVYDASDRKVKKVVANGLPGGSFDASQITTSSALTGNPLMQNRLGVALVSEVNAATIILASTAGKSIYVGGGFTVMASGTAGGGTSVSLKCSGGTIIATFPVANSYLLDGIPRGPFASSGSLGGGPTLASSLTRGCAAGEAVLISSVGTITTMTHMYYNVPYTVQ